MSVSAIKNKLDLEVQTNDEAAEVFIIDGRFNLADRGKGFMNTFKLAPGIYTVKVSTGYESREQHVILRDGPEKIEFRRIPFASPAPLEETAKTHKYHIAAAYTESRKVHFKAGTGSEIFIFVRDWTPPQLPDRPFHTSPQPHKGLRLRDKNGDEVVDFSKQSKSQSDYDPWAACNVQLDPGLYRLSLDLPSGARLEQTLVASKGWQTQVFLLQRNYGPEPADRRADMVGASILLSKESGFKPNNLQMRLVETARLGLTNTRQVLSDKIVGEILNGKFNNPMLGILGAYLLLSNKQIRLDLLHTVIGNLRNLLGDNQHPDVEALALRLGTKETSYIFEFPPMLLRSWWQILHATVDKTSLVPLDSFASKFSDRLWTGEPWLLWTVPNEAGKGLKDSPSLLGESTKKEEIIKLQTGYISFGGSSTAKNSRKAEPEGRRKRASKTKHTSKIGKAYRTSQSGAVEQNTGTQLTKSEIRRLVKTIGLPRARLQEIIKQGGREISGDVKSKVLRKARKK